MGGPYFSSARSTISIARSTPAQKPRGWARTTRIMGTSPNGGAAPKVLPGSSDMACGTHGGNVGPGLLSVAHDMSGLGSTRSVRWYWGTLESPDAPDGSPTGCANDQVPERIRAL